MKGIAMTTRTTLPLILSLALLLGAIGCAPEAAELDAPEDALVAPVAELTIKFVEEGAAIELTLTNISDAEIILADRGLNRGYGFILSDASGKADVPRDLFAPETPGQLPQTINVQLGSVSRVYVQPGEDYRLVLPLSGFEPGRSYSMQAIRRVQLKTTEQDGTRVYQTITSNALHFTAVTSSSVVESIDTP